MKKGISKYIAIGVLFVWAAAMFFVVRVSCSRGLYSVSDFGEKVLYVLLALLFGLVYYCIYTRMKSRASRIAWSAILAAVCVAVGYFMNNYWSYLSWNYTFNWEEPIISYSYFLEYDISYTVGFGEYRYPAVFLAMCVLNLVFVLIFERLISLVYKLFEEER